MVLYFLRDESQNITIINEGAFLENEIRINFAKK